MKVIGNLTLSLGIAAVLFGETIASSHRIVNIQDIVVQSPTCWPWNQGHGLGDLERPMLIEKAKEWCASRSPLQPKQSWGPWAPKTLQGNTKKTSLIHIWPCLQWSNQNIPGHLDGDDFQMLSWPLKFYQLSKVVSQTGPHLKQFKLC